MKRFCLKLLSSSSWGCELKNLYSFSVCSLDSHPPREDVSWKEYSALKEYAKEVILLVRMWVEKNWKSFRTGGAYGHPPREDVSWKNFSINLSIFCRCHPPREDVSWKIVFFHSTSMYPGHPPREDVSWKFGYQAKAKGTCHPPREDVSWKWNRLL